MTGGFYMATRNWHILCWNIRGLNATDNWNAVRYKIEESACSIVYLQETKKDFFDLAFIRKFAPRRFDKFEFVPSVGASGGILVLWASSSFPGTVLAKEPFALTLEFVSVHNLEIWNLTIVYGPCQQQARSEFVSWMRNISIQPDDDWLFLGDFNFYRSLENRNKPGGNVADTLMFNDIIGHLGLEELPLKGRAFTWSNMQQNPLLEQLDWFFTSVNWTHSFPNTLVLPLAKITSPVKSLLAPPFPSPISLGLRTFGLTIMVSWKLFKVVGLNQ
jgi:hypothetical protein